MAQKHNEQYVNAPMTRLGTIGWPDQDRRVIRSSAFVASKWTAENPILQLGEVGYETDTNKLKVGDGVTKWNSLPYAGDGAGSSLPDQTGHSGEFLTTDGTDASWGAVSEVPSTTGATQGDVLTVDSNGDAVWQAGGSGLPDQTGQSGKFLTTDGTDASWSDKPLVNNTAQTASLAIKGSTSALGTIAIGDDSGSTQQFAISIGNYAKAQALGAIQLGGHGVMGQRKNTDANTFKVGNANGNFEIMSADGTIPEARLADTTNAQQGDVLTLDSTGNAVWQAGGGGGGGSYTAGTGIDITNDVISTQVPMGVVSTYNFTVTTGGTDTLAIGAYARAMAAFGSAAQSMAIGNNSYTYGSYSTAIGGSSYAKLYGTAVGATVRADNWSTAIGSNIYAGTNGIAIGCGGYTQQTGTANAFDIFMTSDGSTIKQYTMCDNNGQIPAARLGTGYDPTKTQTLKNVQGVLTWVDD